MQPLHPPRPTLGIFLDPPTRMAAAWFKTVQRAFLDTTLAVLNQRIASTHFAASSKVDAYIVVASEPVVLKGFD